MSFIYSPFHLEQKVCQLYCKMGIYYPQEIDIEKIASLRRIHLEFSDKDNYAYGVGSLQIININKYLTPLQQRICFFHEWCHIECHVGNQTKMPKLFREYQEWGAVNFTRYAAIPFHMLKFIDWTSTTIIKDMAKMFYVSEELCQQRVEQINRNKFIKKSKELV